MIKGKSQKVFFLIIFCLLFYLGANYFSNYLNSKRNLYEKVKKDFSGEVSKSLLNLSFSMSKLSRDLDQKKDLVFSDTNIARRFFSSYLKLSELDEIKIFSEECQLVWNFSLLQGGEGECFGKSLESFSVASYKKTPLVSVVKKVSLKGKLYFIQGSLNLGQAWLRNLPLLSDQLSKGGFSISSEFFSKGSSERIFFNFFGNTSKRESLTIYLLTDHYAYFLLNFFLKGKTKDNFWGLEFFLLLVLLIVFVVFFEERKKQKKEGKIYDGFESWCKKALLLNQKELYSLCLAEMRRDEGYFSSKVYKPSAEIIAKKLQDNFNLQIRVKNLEKKIEDYQEENIFSSQKNQAFGEYNSLSEQIRQMSPMSSFHLEKIESLSMEAYQLVVGSLRKKIEMLFYQFSEWKKEGKSLGFKKYMRSLYETKGVEEGASLLEDQIYFFVSAITSVKEELEYSATLLGVISEHKKSAALPLNHWEYFVKPYEKKKREKVFGTIRNATELYIFYNKNIKFSFEKIDREATMPIYINKARMISSLCHIFDFYSYSNSDSKTKLINIKFKSEKGKDFLLISLDKELLKEEQDYVSEKLQFSESLLSPLGVLLRHLRLEGSSFLSLEWAREEIRAHSALKQGSQRELGL